MCCSCCLAWCGHIALLVTSVWSHICACSQFCSCLIAVGLAYAVLIASALLFMVFLYCQIPVMGVSSSYCQIPVLGMSSSVRLLPDRSTTHSVMHFWSNISYVLFYYTELYINIHHLIRIDRVVQFLHFVSAQFSCWFDASGEVYCCFTMTT